LETQDDKHKDYQLLKLDRIDFERRISVEKEMEKSMEYLNQITVEFDENDKIIIVPSFFGIKFFEISSGKLVRLIGKHESTERFLKIALYQGRAMKNVSNTASVSGTTTNKKEADPTLYSTSFKKNKFYIFSKREPEDSEEKGHGINTRGML